MNQIDQFWKDWGLDIRRKFPCWPSTNILYRAAYLTGGGSFGPRTPNVEYAAQDFYLAQSIWKTMPEDLKDFTYVFYAQPWPWKRKCKELGISKHRYYKFREQVYDFTEPRL